ncbi:FAD-dependent oxidoreductase, partial [Salmonella sp. s51933]|uniref:FAD-dependent oxidoreductase n=1 Tax=Salmonella sp. s51933 TaxID=3160127 RepID=UPI0037548BC8
GAYKTTLAGKTDKMGRLLVDNYLQVKGITDVYAIGDCCDTPEIKVATGAQAHGEHVAENIKLKGEGKEPKPYTVNEKISMCLCGGRGGGAVQMGNGWVFGDWFARFIKAKDVFVSITWKAMGREVPKE